MQHQCVECGWPEPRRALSEKERAKHYASHERDRLRAIEKAREVNLAKGRKAAKQKAALRQGDLAAYA